MPMTIACTKCAKQLRLPEGLAGQLVSCPSCHTAFTVADHAGRVSLRAWGEPEPAPPPSRGRPVDRMPPAPQGEPRQARPFVFRVEVTHDPERLLLGPAQARVTPQGLELRDAHGDIHDVPVGAQAHHLGGNRLSVRVGGREVTLRITQRACQQAKLAHELVLFLSRKRAVLQLSEFRPNKALGLLALVPVLAGLLMLCGGVSGPALAWIYIGFAGVFCAVTAFVVRNEAMAQHQRLLWTAALWGIGVVLLPLAMALVRPPTRQATVRFPEPVEEVRIDNWQAVGEDGRWAAQFPGGAHAIQGQLFGGVRGEWRQFQGWTSNAGRGRALFEVWHRDLTRQELVDQAQAALFNDVRDGFQAAMPDAQVTNTNDITLQGQTGKEFVFSQGGGWSKVQVYLVGTRLYVLRTSWPLDIVRQHDVDFFFQSFRLIEPPAPVRPFDRDKDAGPQPVPPDDRGPPPWTPQRKRVEVPTPDQLQGLIAYWSFDEGRGTDIKDATGNGRNGKVRGGWWIDGVSGKALLFDGKGDFFDFSKADGLNLKGTGFTVSGWVAVRDRDGPLLAMCSSHHPVSNIRLEVRGGCLRCTLGTDEVDNTKLLSGGPIPINDGAWHHVAVFCKDTGGVELYVDGSARHQAKSNLRGPLTTDFRALGCQPTLGVNRGDPHEYCACAVDEFCIFNRALTQAEIKKLAGVR